MGGLLLGISGNVRIEAQGTTIRGDHTTKPTTIIGTHVIIFIKSQGDEPKKKKKKKKMGQRRITATKKPS